MQPSGAKLWQLKYRIHGKEKVALGRYPNVGLAEARKRRNDAKVELVNGKNPSLEKQRRAVQAQEDASNTFALVAAQYIEKRNHIESMFDHLEHQRRVVTRHWRSPASLIPPHPRAAPDSANR